MYSFMLVIINVEMPRKKFLPIFWSIVKTFGSKSFFIRNLRTNGCLILAGLPYVICICIWYIYSYFGMLYQQEPGNRTLYVHIHIFVPLTVK
jgi:hypothetical protein